MDKSECVFHLLKPQFTFKKPHFLTSKPLFHYIATWNLHAPTSILATDSWLSYSQMRRNSFFFGSKLFPNSRKQFSNSRSSFPNGVLSFPNQGSSYKKGPLRNDETLRGNDAPCLGNAQRKAWGRLRRYADRMPIFGKLNLYCIFTGRQKEIFISQKSVEIGEARKQQGLFARLYRSFLLRFVRIVLWEMAGVRSA